MSTHKNIDRVCIVIIVLCLIVTVLFMNGQALGLEAATRSMGYEETLFDTSRVHTIDIVIDDWDAFIATCESETYAECAVVIDGEAVKNVAIRGKGNTSLSSVKSMGSERYSFKIEFDQYQDGKSYHGLDKLSLNNIIQDNTYMKDYLTYRMMDAFGVDSPLCSFAYLTVNGEDWGLYLAVESVEDSFLERNYGRDTGELYKPDSMSFGGGGPGNGKNFNMDDFFNRDSESGESSESTSDSGNTGGFGGFPGGGQMPGGEMPSMPEGFDPSQFGGGASGFTPPTGDGENGGAMWASRPTGSTGDSSSFLPPAGEGAAAAADEGEASDSGRTRPSRGGGFNFDFGGVFGGMGSSDVKLQYSDDDPDSYSNIFNNAKTDVNSADQARLIEAIRKLNAQEDIEETVDVDEVIRYFVVHNFVCNGDSYTGSIIHNYYLHESDGLLSMIPWDYNLAFGTFQSNDATGTVNDPIDTPMSASDGSDRPMWGWIAQSEEYTEMYHQYFAEFLDSVDILGIIDEAYGLIKDYVAKDPTAFCTYEEFETGVATLRSFCEKRIESVRGQLDGTIPSTTAGQNADDSALVDASDITLSDMGRQGGAGGGDNQGGGFPGGGFGGRGDSSESNDSSESGEGGGAMWASRPTGSDGESGGEMPEGFTPPTGDGENGGAMWASRPTGSDGEGSENGGFSGGFPGDGDFSANLSKEGSSERPDMGSFDGGSGFGGGSSVSAQDWIWVGVSVAALAVGLLAAILYKKRG